VAVIELDLDAPPAPQPTRPPIHLLRPLGLTLAVALLLTLGGAAPITPTLLRSLGVIPLAFEDTWYELGGDHLYTLGSPTEPARDVSSYSLDPIRRDWTLANRSNAIDDPDVIYSRPRAVPADGVLLLQGESFTTWILDPGTGGLLWSTAGWPVPLGAGRALVQEPHFRPGTEYDQKSGDPGELFWSAAGQPHIEPPLRTTLSGVDVRTGRPAWTLEMPGAVFTAPVDDGSGVLMVATDKLTVLDRDTGKVLRERPVPRGEFDQEIGWVEVVGDLLLLSRNYGDNWGAVDTYATDTLEKRSELNVPPLQTYEGSCTGLPCLKEEAGLAVLDPRTGQPAWRTKQNVELTRRGDAVLEMQSMSSRPYRMRDPATGATTADLKSWDGVVATSESDQPLVVTKIDAARASTVFGVLPRGGTRVQPLGYSGAILVECTSNDRFVACRVPGGVQVWAYRA